MDRNFGGVVWTDHALRRLKQRGISQGDAWATWRAESGALWESVSESATGRVRLSHLPAAGAVIGRRIPGEFPVLEEFFPGNGGVLELRPGKRA